MSTTLSLNPREKSEITYPFCWHNSPFTADELDAIESYCNDFELTKGVVVGEEGEGTDSEKRKSNIRFIEPCNNNHWIFEKINTVIKDLNDRYYGFDLTGYDAIQYTEYDDTGAKYDWHMDTIVGPNRGTNMVQTRKLSIVIPLNDPSEYEGGEFHIQTGDPDDPLVVEQKRGNVIAFPSFMIHRVAPIIKGKRKSLVVWVVGPKFK